MTQKTELTLLQMIDRHLEVQTLLETRIHLETLHLQTLLDLQTPLLLLQIQLEIQTRVEVLHITLVKQQTHQETLTLAELQLT